MGRLFKAVIANEAPGHRVAQGASPKATNYQGLWKDCWVKKSIKQNKK